MKIEVPPSFAGGSPNTLKEILLADSLPDVSSGGGSILPDSMRQKPMRALSRIFVRLVRQPLPVTNCSERT